MKREVCQVRGEILLRDPTTRLLRDVHIHYEIIHITHIHYEIYITRYMYTLRDYVHIT